jgi:hypothetical protein
MTFSHFLLKEKNFLFSPKSINSCLILRETKIKVYEIENVQIYYLDLLVLALLVSVPVSVLAPALPLCRRLGSRPVPATATVIVPFK